MKYEYKQLYEDLIKELENKSFNELIKELNEYEIQYTLLEGKLELLRKALEEHFHRNFLVKRDYLIEISYDGEDMDLKDGFLDKAIDICEKYLDEDELALVSISYDYLGEIRNKLYKDNIKTYEKYNNKGNYNVNYIDDIEKYEDQLNMMGED
ncbi:TPA: hypothetical protein ACF2DD_002100 [Clostridium perfringens]